MRGFLILLSALVLAVGAVDAYLLISTNAPIMAFWGVVFGVLVPVIGVVQAWVEVRREPTSPLRGHPAALILTGLALTVGAILPLADAVYRHHVDSAQR